MKVLKVELDKFKCFNKTSFDLSKITLLTGANSSGKSSFLYSILSMLQSERFPLFLSPNGEFVDLGSFEELSFNNQKTHPIEISFEIQVNNIYSYYRLPNGIYKIRTKWRENQVNKLPQLDSLFFSGSNLIIQIENRDRKYFLSLKHSGGMGYAINKVRPRLEKIAEIRKAKAFQFTRKIIEIVDAPFDSVETIFEKIFLNKKIHALYQYSEMFEELHNNIDFNSNFIGSFRTPPERTYYQKSKSGSRIDISGEGYIDQIIEWEEINNRKFKELNKILNKLQIVSAIKSKKMEGGRFELQARINKNGIWASLTDVGFGVSQFIPIIIADMQLENSSLLMMSQPEIHLHPKIQASLGDYLTEQSKRNRKRYIVETHSEYLLNRIRLNITKGILSPNDVSVYYFSNGQDGTKVYKILLTAKGEVKNAPPDFFDTYMMDVMDIAISS